MELLDEEDSENATEAAARNNSDAELSRRRRDEESEDVTQFDYDKERYDCMILLLDVDTLELKMEFGNCKSGGSGGVCRRKLFNQTTTCPIGWFYENCKPISEHL